MSPDYRTDSFENAFEDVSAGAPKLKSENYQTSGVYPIIDQGVQHVCGYTDDKRSLALVELPVIIFGDHTRVFKFVDYPFCVGAEGVRLIKPRKTLDAKFAFYLLKNLTIQQAGYSRHYKFLKRKTIRFPVDISEQRRIAAILDQSEALRRKQRLAISSTLELPRRLFVSMFGEPVSNPNRWPTKRLGEVGELDRGISKHRPRNDPILLGGPYPLIQTGDIANSDGYVRAHSSTYSEAGLKQSRLWPAGTLGITIAANIGKTAILTFEACFPDSIVGFTPKQEVKVEYVRIWMSFLQKSLEENAPQFAQKNINLAILRALEVPIPPLELQSRFVGAIARLTELKSKLTDSSKYLDDLFASLQQSAFGVTP